MAGQRKFDILPDLPDIRDRPYRPHLRALEPGIYPRIPFAVRDQGTDNSCTGFALAHAIDLLRMRETGADQPAPVSARMLYEMAKHNDEWDGTAYEGSSLRGAIKGFYRNGVCSEAMAPDTPGNKNWTLTYEMAKQARELRLGAYFRVEPDLTDYHAAINDTGCIFVSAQIHSGWDKPQDGKILAGGDARGGHAFVIAGYDDTGFWVLNSWGPKWGRSGVAHWLYEDWAATVMDAWVLQIGVRAPGAFGAAPRSGPAKPSSFFGFGEPRRGDILGHFVNIDDGRHVTTGKYWSPDVTEMQETVKRLTNSAANDGAGYEHLVIYAHGGLNSLADDAARIAAWKRNKVFSKHKIYHFHMMWGSGLLEEAFGEMSRSDTLARAGGRFTDWMFETGPGKHFGERAWRNMKTDTLMAFGGHSEFDGGYKGLKPLLTGLDK
ncbi:MAG: C1 family peptidase, partial [Alphaproteobacteria bacterium]|nr:C1 family peptidase [Alphaproteobacteria bacterium]